MSTLRSCPHGEERPESCPICRDETREDPLPPPPTPLAKKTSHLGTRARSSISGTPRLMENALFASLPHDLLARLESQMTPRDHAAGELLLRQGEDGDSILFIVAGEVEITTRDESGAPQRIGRVGPGQFVGEMAILTDEPRLADATALEPVRVLALPGEAFHRTARQHPVVAVVLTNLISSRLGRAHFDVLAGKTIAGYRFGRPLGRGGMGVVYEATHTESGRRVALKMLHHRLVFDIRALSQFEREATIIESFDHPGIVRMHESFHAFHTYFIALEYCEGCTLGTLIHTRKGLPEVVSRKIIGQLGKALSYAHSHGVVHRDLKPANIMLQRNGELKLMDFGLARPRLESEAALGRLLMGTPGYMAPEQMLGRQIGVEADYFSVGCVLYEMLTGMPLFEAGRIADVLEHHAAKKGPRLDLLPRGVSPELRDVLEGALRPDPEERTLDLERISSWAATVEP